MDAVNDIVKELQELGSPLANMPRVTPFVVPEGYFSSFSVTHITQDKDPVLHLPKTMPFEVPQGYFDQLTQTIVARAEQPVFGKMQDHPFEAPAGYFDNFAGNMLAAAKAADAGAMQQEAPAVQKETKVIDLRPQWKNLRWAAAAIAVIGIGISSYLAYNNTSGSAGKGSAAHQLALLDKSIIDSYVQQNIDDFDAEMLTEHNIAFNESAEKSIHTLNKKDIIQYLDNDAGWSEGEMN